MVGGSDEDVERAMPIFDALRPPGRREDGFVHAGAVGAGHFTKMVHNGVEYALMTAHAEGYELLAAESLVKDPQGVYQAWTNGTVVRSWLQQLLAKALSEDRGQDNRTVPTRCTRCALRAEATALLAVPTRTTAWLSRPPTSLSVPCRTAAESRKTVGSHQLPSSSTRWRLSDPQAHTDDLKCHIRRDAAGPPD